MAKISSVILGDVTIAIRRTPRHKLVIRMPAPWDKRMPGYRSQLERRNLHIVNEVFKEASHATKGLAWRQRMIIIREALKGVKYVEKEPKVITTLTDKQLEAKIEDVRNKVIAKKNELMSKA